MIVLAKQRAAAAGVGAARAAAAAAERTGASPAGGASAELSGVSVSFGGRLALSDVSLRIGSGEAVCLVGPSGGGKSTILNLLAGLLAPTEGRVALDGERVEGPGPDRAMVFQDAALFPWLTLAQNVAFPLEVAGVPVAERAERAEALLRLVHLASFRDAYPHELSGGMRQRGAIARALAGSPRMILFDEPFAALDGQMRELLQGEVERIVGAARTTMVFVTHQIDEAVRLADRVVLVGARPGRVIGEIQVALPRPRPQADARSAELVAEIAAAIRDEVQKVAREEADDVWGAEGGGDGGDPRRGVGRGL